MCTVRLVSSWDYPVLALQFKIFKSSSSISRCALGSYSILPHPWEEWQ
jgi:hypothetical protein